MIAQSKGQFYHKGFDKQKRADITIDLRWPPSEKIKQWTKEQKKECLAFIDRYEAIFDAFKKELIEALNTKADQ